MGCVLNGLITAVRFLTVVPVPGRGLDGPDAVGRAAAWFSPVGLALGLLLALADWLLFRLFPPLLSSLLVLTVWKLLTGGLHLDGLADCLDGLAARDPDRALAIMRDSRIGTFGAVGLILLLLLALLALAELPRVVRGQALVLAPVVGRYAPLLLARSFRPISADQSSGRAFIKAVSGAALLAGGAAVAVVAGVLLWPYGLIVAGTGLGAAWGAGWVLSRRLRGLTGDGLGAGVELAELGVLLTAVAVARLAPS